MRRGGVGLGSVAQVYAYGPSQVNAQLQEDPSRRQFPSWLMSHEQEKAKAALRGGPRGQVATWNAPTLYQHIPSLLLIQPLARMRPGR